MNFTREYPVGAVRKAHRCDCCGTIISIGQPAIRWAGMTDGEFGSTVMHPECRAAEIELNRLHDPNADEWMPLRDIDPEDRPWLIEEHPIVAERLGLVAHQQGRVG